MKVTATMQMYQTHAHHMVHFLEITSFSGPAMMHPTTAPQGLADASSAYFSVCELTGMLYCAANKSFGA